MSDHVEAVIALAHCQDYALITVDKDGKIKILAAATPNNFQLLGGLEILKTRLVNLFEEDK